MKNAYEVCLRRNTRSSAAKLEEAKQELQESYDREQEKYDVSMYVKRFMQLPNYNTKNPILQGDGKRVHKKKGHKQGSNKSQQS